MGNNSKPWLNYTSDVPEREYFKTPKKKRHFKWALFWLIFGTHVGAHRLYLWDAKKAGLTIIIFYVSCISLLFLSALLLPEFFTLPYEKLEDIAINISVYVPWFLIVLFELPRLKRRVDFKNKKHLLL